MALVNNTATVTTNDDSGDDDCKLSTLDHTIHCLLVSVPVEVRTKSKATHVHNLMMARAKKEMILTRHFWASVVANNVDNTLTFVCRLCAMVPLVPLLKDTKDHLFTNKRTLTRTPSVNLTMILGCCLKVCCANKLCKLCV